MEDTQTTQEELLENFWPGITHIVLEVTDDKTKSKEERKRLQIEHASTISYHAKLVKLADKICNLRDMAHSPPKNWSLERRREYFDWAQQVVNQMRGTHPQLEALFEAAYNQRP